MAWIETHQSLPKHPKLIKAASLVNMDRHSYMAHLICFWLWALDYADKEGNLPAYITEFTIAEGAEISKKRAINFLKSLINCASDGHAGFIERIGDHYRIHDWNDFTGGFLLSRETKKESNRLRQQRYRNAHITHTPPLNNTDVTPMSPSDNAPTVPYPTVPYPTVVTSTTIGDRKFGEIVTLYRKNMGEPNGIISDKIQEAMTVYEFDWIIDAMKDCVVREKRTWQNVEWKLQDWKRYGKGNNNGHKQSEFPKKQPAPETLHYVDGVGED